MPSIKMTVSPGAAPLAALDSEQGTLRVLQSLVAVPVGETNHSAA
jgi:hypothetical protein